MAKKTGIRGPYKELGAHNKNHETLPDEITLRDEILELKRQLMVLRRTNEQYLVKLRKYEHEAKRKDKQVEELMDPRKVVFQNADVTKVLSTKGAAILMNLKDQNNALIQMILNKDLHIRRLVAEIKMSKLYATTRKNECYRAEINRLRNLLEKSQETLRENDVHQPARSICAGGNSLLELSSSSDQSSPRDLDELRVSILSLESHVKHCNDLLTKKNQEISLLTNELNFLKKFIRYKTCKNKTFEGNFKNQNFSMSDYTHKWTEHFASTKTFTSDVFDRSEKHLQTENLPRSAPAVSTKWFSSIDSPDYTKDESSSHIAGHKEENEAEENAESAVIIKTNKENFERVPALGKSLFHNLAANEILKEEKILSNSRRTVCTKEKWMKALNKYRELKQLKAEQFSACAETQNGEDNVVEILNLEDEKVKTPNKALHEEAEDSCEELSPESSNEETRVDTNETSPNPDVSDNKTPETCQNSISPVLNKNEESFEMFSNDESQKPLKSFVDIQKELTVALENTRNSEETEESRMTFRREIYHRSFDSSFDSENSYSINQRVRQVQVEVQINSVSPQNEGDQSGDSTSENNLILDYATENGENDAPDLHDFNDDDDVVVREK